MTKSAAWRFQPGWYFVTGDYSWFVVVGEFNADGKLDLAVEDDNSGRSRRMRSAEES